MNTQSKRRHGFTLVEMIIYVAFFSVLSILTVNATITVMKSFYALRMSQNISQSATTAIERMSHEIRNSYAVDTTNSVFSSSPGQLSLLAKDSLGTTYTIRFYVNAANQLALQVAGVEKGVLLAKTVTVTNLVFRQVTTTGSKAIKIEMSLRDSRQGTSKVVKFYDTVVLRGSVH